MRDIFTDLYKKVIGFFQASQEKEEAEDNAKDVARNRLKLVLMQDRTNLTPYLLERMRGEMIEVLSKYVEMDKDELELNFEQEGDSMALMLSIPVLRAKDEEEIQAVIDAEEKEKSDKEKEDGDEEEKDKVEDENDEVDAEESEETENSDEESLEEEKKDDEEETAEDEKESEKAEETKEDVVSEETVAENKPSKKQKNKATKQ